MKRSLDTVDPEMAAAVAAEEARQAQTLELIASENHVSRSVLEAMGTVLTDKYAEGYPGKRWYNGCDNVDVVERLAIDRCRELFGAEHANVQPHSGTNANLAVYLAALKPNQKIMGMRLDQGGHLSHGLEINLSGRMYKPVHYGVREDTEMLDMEDIRRLAKAERPDLLVVGASAYPREIDFEAFGAIAKEVGCLLLADIAHIAGLVVGKAHSDPVPHADFVTTTTHKTLRGPRGGVILCTSEWASAVDTAIFPGIQGGPLENVIAAKGVAFREALHQDFHAYAAAIVANARALAGELIERGWRLVSGGTDNHLLLVDLRSKFPQLNGRTAANWLAGAGIVANKNAIPFDHRPPSEASGVRFGTPAVTTRGLGPDEMIRLADWIDDVLSSGGNAETLSTVRAQVSEMCGQFPIPERD